MPIMKHLNFNIRLVKIVLGGEGDIVDLARLIDGCEFNKKYVPVSVTLYFLVENTNFFQLIVS